CLLEAQVELLLLETGELRIQFIRGHRPDFLGLHDDYLSYSAMRWTKRVRIESLAAPSRSASRAVSSSTPSSSNITRPGLTRQAQKSTAPLPLPMRTSVGLPVTGTSGKIRIQTRPWR